MNQIGVLGGSVAGLFTTPRGGEPMLSRERVECVAGRGIVGDRYAEGTGSFSGKNHEDRNLTIIEGRSLIGSARRVGWI